MASKEQLFRISSAIPEDFQFNNTKAMKDFFFFDLKSSSSLSIYAEIWVSEKMSIQQLSWIISNVLYDKLVLSIMVSTFQTS